MSAKIGLILSSMEGVHKFLADSGRRVIRITYDEDVVTVAQILATLAEQGINIQGQPRWVN